MTALNVTRKLIRDHLADGEMKPGSEIALKIDQTLTQDATGTMVMLALQALELDYVRTELSAQYVDHNLLQEDNKNPDDHLFLESACRRFGVWYSRAGNGVSHPVHMQRFGAPGKTLLGSDSHTPAAGSLGMLAIGAGGLDVAMAMAGEPYRLRMPEVRGVKLTGELSDWVSAKDVILEMLRRHGVDGGVGQVIEYYGPGLESLTAMDRHVIANMGTELGATSTVFPSDERAKTFLESEGRGDDWREIVADEGCAYDIDEEIDLSGLAPLIAKPCSPGNVVPVTDVAGEEIYQSYIGSSANPGYRDFAVAAHMVRGRTVPDTVSLDVNPTSRQLLTMLTADGWLADLVQAGARIHQAGCNGCIGMGQAPASGRNSLRTVPRNFPGRSGTPEDSVFLCSPETAAASALVGRIADPREVARDFVIRAPGELVSTGKIVNMDLFSRPEQPGEAQDVELYKGPNVTEIPEMAALPDAMELPVLLKTGDDISTDEIMPAGAKVLPFRSNIPRIADFVFRQVDESYIHRAKSLLDDAEDAAAAGHVVVGGRNYGQGSSREHAAIAPRYLGLRAVLAKSYARIHKRNLVNYGILPLVFAEDADYDAIGDDTTLVFENLRDAVKNGEDVVAKADGKDIRLKLDVSGREREYLLQGSRINAWKAEHDDTGGAEIRRYGR